MDKTEGKTNIYDINAEIRSWKCAEKKDDEKQSREEKEIMGDVMSNHREYSEEVIEEESMLKKQTILESLWKMRKI